MNRRYNVSTMLVAMLIVCVPRLVQGQASNTGSWTEKICQRPVVDGPLAERRPDESGPPPAVCAG